MPNASRYLERGYAYHLTHRCHDRRFLLRTIRERNDYRKWLREGVRRYGVPVYNYCITSNHVHVIVQVDDPDAVSSMMQLASATVARHWNRLKNMDYRVECTCRCDAYVERLALAAKAPEPQEPPESAQANRER